ncbi:hydrophobic surface binding protein [Mycena galericulata]|nr:hydrophobic surface binding protein [Mycena galericulata]
MVQISRSFFSLSLLAVSLATPVKRTVAQVEVDIASISSQVTALDNDINGFPASGLVGALGIHSAATTLVSTLNQGTSDVQSNGAFDESDATTILNDVEAFEPTILAALTAIATKEADFAALPISGIPALVLSDLQSLNASTVAFAGALTSAAPADDQAQAESIESSILSAFATAIAAYE